MARERNAGNVAGGKPKKQFKEKRLAENIISCNEENPEVYGVFQGVENMINAEGEPMASKLNPEQPIMLVRMLDIDSGEPFAIWYNAGLGGALKFHKVSKNMPIKIEYLGKIKIDDYPCNSYSITGLEAV